MNTLKREEIVGAVMLGFGIVFFLVAGFKATLPAGVDPGDLAAVGLFFIMMGMVFYFPSLLQDAAGNTSTMRVVVFMVTSVFVILTVKVGWNAKNLEELAITESWRWVLASLLGGKVLQSYVEKGTEPRKPSADAKLSKQALDELKRGASV